MPRQFQALGGRPPERTELILHLLTTTLAGNLFPLLGEKFKVASPSMPSGSSIAFHRRARRRTGPEPAGTNGNLLMPAWRE